MDKIFDSHVVHNVFDISNARYTESKSLASIIEHDSIWYFKLSFFSLRCSIAWQVFGSTFISSITIIREIDEIEYSRSSLGTKDDRHFYRVDERSNFSHHESTKRYQACLNSCTRRKIDENCTFSRCVSNRKWSIRVRILPKWICETSLLLYL